MPYKWGQRALVVILLFVCLACDSCAIARTVDLGESFGFGWTNVISIRGTGWKIKLGVPFHYDTFDAETGPIDCLEIIVMKRGSKSRQLSLAMRPGQPEICTSTTGHFDGFSIQVQCEGECTFVVEKSD